MNEDIFDAVYLDHATKSFQDGLIRFEGVYFPGPLGHEKRMLSGVSSDIEEYAGIDGSGLDEVPEKKQHWFFICTIIKDAPIDEIPHVSLVLETKEVGGEVEVFPITTPKTRRFLPALKGEVESFSLESIKVGKTDYSSKSSGARKIAHLLHVHDLSKMRGSRTTLILSEYLSRIILNMSSMVSIVSFHREDPVDERVLRE